MPGDADAAACHAFRRNACIAAKLRQHFPKLLSRLAERLSFCHVKLTVGYIPCSQIHKRHLAHVRHRIHTEAVSRARTDFKQCARPAGRSHRCDGVLCNHADFQELIHDARHACCTKPRALCKRSAGYRPFPLYEIENQLKVMVFQIRLRPGNCLIHCFLHPNSLFVTFLAVRVKFPFAAAYKMARDNLCPNGSLSI